MTELLSVKNLKVAFFNEERQQFNTVVQRIDLNIKKGEVLALVGESGSGKSVSAMALIKLLPTDKVRIEADTIELTLDDKITDLTTASLEQLSQIRGGEIGVIFQDPLIALNPVHRVHQQIEEVFKYHRNDLERCDYHKETNTLLTQVGIKNPTEKACLYPHQLSGGMRQRVMIAIALAGKPRLLIADEPTTSLDVTVQAQILSLLQDLQEQYEMGILFISHDLAVVRAISDRVVVMQNGHIIESNSTEALIASPQHHYTKKLIKSSRLVR